MKDFLTMSRQLANIQRCSTTRRIKQQSVAEHSYYVAVISLLLAQELKGDVDLGLLLQKALFHDLEEAMTGDIIYPLKHSSPEVNATLEEITVEYCRKIFEKKFPKYEHFRGIQRFSKDGYEGEIVRLADAIELMVYCYEEFVNGNGHMQELLLRAIKITKSCLLFKESQETKKLITTIQRRIKNGQSN
jgi:5'-deoxynucleotidase YfbR-like HD superfamily hydrolase